MTVLRPAMHRVTSSEKLSFYDIVEDETGKSYVLTVSEDETFAACSCPKGRRGEVCPHVEAVFAMVDGKDEKQVH